MAGGGTQSTADALVVFGITGDLANKIPSSPASARG
jgi:glucose-6-phosphate 1-dehydrogenase